MKAGSGEEIEADVVAEDRVALAVGHLIDEPQKDVPVGRLAGSQQPRDDDDRARDEKRKMPSAGRPEQPPMAACAQCLPPVQGTARSLSSQVGMQANRSTR